MTRRERDLLELLACTLVAFYDAVDLTIRDFSENGTFSNEPEDQLCATKLAQLKRWVEQSSIDCRKKLQLCDAIEFAEQASNKAERVIHLYSVKPALAIQSHIAEIIDAASDVVFAAGWLYHAMQWYDGQIVQPDLPAEIRTAVSRLSVS